MKRQRIAVAYSGGLNTSVMVPWLKEHYDAEIITVTCNLGQSVELAGLADKAYASGAKRVYIQDLRDEFAEDYVARALKAGALYEQNYPMASPLGRPLLAKVLAEVARRERCTAVAHGCTGKGNDQVRFELSLAAVAPHLKILAPLREWEFRSREEVIEYARRKNVPVTATPERPYSIDENMWGVSVEYGALEDPSNAPPTDAWQWTASPQDAPDAPTLVTLEFDEGIPIALDGEKKSLAQLITELNVAGARNGVGRIDLIENRFTGIKSREIHEAPAALILLGAHRELERLTLDRETFRFKSSVAQEYAQIVFNGYWFTPLRPALDAFVDDTQRTVSGTVHVKLYKGNIEIVGRSSRHSLYDLNLATAARTDAFDHKASEGFLAVTALPVRTYYRVNKKLPKRVKKIRRAARKLTLKLMKPRDES